MRPNLLLFQKLEFGSSFSSVLVGSDLHLVSMRGLTETSTAFNSSMFEELRNLSLIEPSNSFKNSKFSRFRELSSILDLKLTRFPMWISLYSPHVPPLCCFLALFFSVPLFPLSQAIIPKIYWP